MQIPVFFPRGEDIVTGKDMSLQNIINCAGNSEINKEEVIIIFTTCYLPAVQLQVVK